MNALVDETRTWLRGVTALDLDNASVERAMRRRMRERQVDHLEDYRKLLDGDEREALIELVVVPESWLFRDPGAFQLALQHVRTCLAARPLQPARLLCVPCASGEEPYSLAIVLNDAGISPAHAIVHGCDISHAAIERARAGIFTRNAFRSDPGFALERHFEPVAEGWQVDEAVRQRVEFFQASLFALEPPAPYDVVFCRNLMIYFDPPTTARAAAKLAQLLADDGLLLAGPAEIPIFTQHGFKAQRSAHGYGLRKPGAVPEGARHPKGQPASQAQRGGLHWWHGHADSESLRPLSASAPAGAATSAKTPSFPGLAHGAAGRPATPRLPADMPGMPAPAALAGRATGPALPTPPARAPARGAPARALPPGADMPKALDGGAVPAASDGLPHGQPSELPADTLAQAQRLADQGGFAAARKLCEHWLQQHPYSAEACYLAGLAAACEGAPGPAEAHWRRCLYLEPEHYQALCHLAILREQAGDAEQARSLRRRASRVYERHGGAGLPEGGSA
jgi:chemotaxis protein methyltransferase WspC